eukprot:GHVP01027952.1.p2 GENE.GHVP01027952.1~~GHVP01027952.1.p2  ORF type:complete len:147 (-),score=29.89 GHVP01027952.1:1625-2011(-)
MQKMIKSPPSQDKIDRKAIAKRYIKLALGAKEEIEIDTSIKCPNGFVEVASQCWPLVSSKNGVCQVKSEISSLPVEARQKWAESCEINFPKKTSNLCPIGWILEDQKCKVRLSNFYFQKATRRLRRKL